MSGVKPKLNVINANGLAMATPKTQSRTNFLLSNIATSFEVRAKAKKAVDKYTIRNIEICDPLRPQKSVFINSVRLFKRPQEIESVKLPKKNNKKDLLDIAIKSSLNISDNELEPFQSDNFLISCLVPREEKRTAMAIIIPPVMAKEK